MNRTSWVIVGLIWAFIVFMYGVITGSESEKIKWEEKLIGAGVAEWRIDNKTGEAFFYLFSPDQKEELEIEKIK